MQDRSRYDRQVAQYEAIRQLQPIGAVFAHSGVRAQVVVVERNDTPFRGERPANLADEARVETPLADANSLDVLRQ